MRPRYSSQHAAANVSRHTVKVPPEPTWAELECTVYKQTWERKVKPHTSTTFYVMAFDSDHAQDVGARRLGHYTDVDLMDVELLQNEPMEWDAELVRSMMEVEPDYERESRRAQHTERGGRVTP